jgi:hypothetical protein
MQTPHGARPSLLQGSQQSEVCVQPEEVKSGTQPGTTQTPVTSGFDCWQTRLGAHTAGGVSMLPPHGPPSPETHWQPPTTPVADGPSSHVARKGHEPPHVPPTTAPHAEGRVVVVVVVTQSGPGPQHELPLVGSTQMQSCSHVPFAHRSTVHPLPSSQSVSLVQPPVGSVVVVVDDGGGHPDTQSWSSGQGAVGEHDWFVH